MLDEADFRAKYDKAGSLELIGRQAAQLLDDLPAPAGLDAGRVKRVLVAGMGGSALASDFAKTAWGDRLPWPVEIVREYALPGFVDAETLVVCSSFSGSSEETLEAWDKARAAGAQVVAITAGGKLLDTAKQAGLPYVQLPGGIQGRYGVLSGVRAWAALAESLGVKGLADEFGSAARKTEEAARSWVPDVPTQSNQAKQLAEAWLEHAVVIYAGPKLAAMAAKWKVDINENAKHIAFWNLMPEMNHNELSGWGHPVEHGMKVVELMSNLDHPQVNKRYEVMNRLMSDRWAPIEVRAQGETQLEQLVWTFMLGSYASAYLAILNQVEISTLPLVDKLKSQL